MGARIPPILYRHVSSFPDSDLLEGLNRKHEMLVRRVTSAASLGGETIVGRTEVSGGDDNGGSRDTPSEVLDAPEFEAGTADLAAFEERLTETHGGHAVTGSDEVTVAARAADGVPGICGGVVGGVGRSPFGEGRRRRRRRRGSGEGVMGGG